MCWGLDCGQGWYSIIEALSEELQLLSDQTGFQVIIEQVKEKFGQLRVYHQLVQSSEDENHMSPTVLIRIIDKLIAGAEQESANTCDVCGTYAERRTTGYILPLCDEHYAEWENKNNYKKER